MITTLDNYKNIKKENYDEWIDNRRGKLIFLSLIDTVAFIAFIYTLPATRNVAVTSSVMRVGLSGEVWGESECEECKTRTIKVFLSLWDKHATMPLMRIAVCFDGRISSRDRIFTTFLWALSPSPVTLLSCVSMSWFPPTINSQHVRCLLVFTPFAALCNAHLIHSNPPPPILFITWFTRTTVIQISVQIPEPNFSKTHVISLFSHLSPPHSTTSSSL